jgi:threonine dehydratase
MAENNHRQFEITASEFELARERAKDVVLHTPIILSAYLSQRFGGKIVLKAENLQRAGAFKIRGGMNKLFNLGNAAETGVVAGSAGNHAQGLALAAQHFGAKCEIYVPKGASLSKIAATKHYGATVLDGGESVETAVAAAKSRAKESGMAFCHPYDDLDVITGQGTLGLELLEDIDDISTLIVPLGGGGLLAGTALAVKQARPNVKIIGVQASICAPFIHGTFPDGQILTLADGIAVKQPGAITKPIIDTWVDEIVEVDEDSIADAVVLLMEHSKLMVEGGGAVGIAALLTHKVTTSTTGSTCIVLSGGNIDIGLIPNLVRRNESNEGRRLTIFVRLPDRPGSLARLVDVCAKNDANIIEVQHIREGVRLHARETGIQVVLEVKNSQHAKIVLNDVELLGFPNTYKD